MTSGLLTTRWCTRQLPYPLNPCPITHHPQNLRSTPTASVGPPSSSSPFPHLWASPHPSVPLSFLERSRSTTRPSPQCLPSSPTTPLSSQGGHSPQLWPMARKRPAPPRRMGASFPSLAPHQPLSNLPPLNAPRSYPQFQWILNLPWPLMR